MAKLLMIILIHMPLNTAPIDSSTMFCLHIAPSQVNKGTFSLIGNDYGYGAALS